MDMRPSPMQSLPPETLLEIFRYLRFPNLGNWITGKKDLYSTALTCRIFSRLTIPMLWEELTFTINHDRGAQKPYQEKFLEILTPESASNFVYTRDLTLNLSVDSGVTISNSGQCTAIKSTIDKLVNIFEYTAPHLKFLDMKIEPFIPADCDSNETLWALLNACNDAIYHCLGLIAHREIDFPVFCAEIGRSAWAFDVAYRPHLQQMLWLLAPKITSLRISESPYFLNQWLPLMRRVQHLSLQNVGSADTDYAVAMWKAISAMPITKLTMNGFKFPSKLERYVPHTLTQVCLVGTDDIVAASVVCYTQLPQLRTCALNWGKEKNPDVDRSVVITDTVCTKLVEVRFIDSVVPIGLISVIAKRNPQLREVSAPPNISDNDIVNLGKFCPRLAHLSMSNGPLDILRPTIRMTKLGFAATQNLRNLRFMMVHDTDVGYFDEQLLIAIAQNCSLLQQVAFWIAKEMYGTWAKSDIRAEVVGSETFKDHVISIVEVVEGRDWRIPLAAFRVQG